MKITNITSGPRGFFYRGALVSFEGGETREVDLDEKGQLAVKAMPESFKIGASEKDAKAAAMRAQEEQDAAISAQQRELDAAKAASEEAVASKASVERPEDKKPAAKK